MNNEQTNHYLLLQITTDPQHSQAKLAVVTIGHDYTFTNHIPAIDYNREFFIKSNLSTENLAKELEQLERFVTEPIEEEIRVAAINQELAFGKTIRDEKVSDLEFYYSEHWVTVKNTNKLLTLVPQQLRDKYFLLTQKKNGLVILIYAQQYRYSREIGKYSELDYSTSFTQSHNLTKLELATLLTSIFKQDYLTPNGELAIFHPNNVVKLIDALSPVFTSADPYDYAVEIIEEEYFNNGFEKLLVS